MAFFSIPWMIDRVIAFYTVCLSICRERGLMGLLLSCLHSRILFSEAAIRLCFQRISVAFT